MRHGSIALIFLTIALAPRAARACECVESTPAAAFAAHVAVFEGRVVEVQPGDPSGYTSVVMEVVQYWKGISTERITVFTPTAESMCGLPFDTEQSWLVYADREGERLVTGLCARTRRIEDAEADIAVLGAGIVPVEITDDDEVEPPATGSARQGAPATRAGCASCAAAPSGRIPSLWALAPVALLLRRRRRAFSSKRY